MKLDVLTACSETVNLKGVKCCFAGSLKTSKIGSPSRDERKS